MATWGTKSVASIGRDRPRLAPLVRPHHHRPRRVHGRRNGLAVARPLFPGRSPRLPGALLGPKRAGGAGAENELSSGDIERVGDGRAILRCALRRGSLRSWARHRRRTTRWSAKVFDRRSKRRASRGPARHSRGRHEVTSPNSVFRSRNSAIETRCASRSRHEAVDTRHHYCAERHQPSG